MLYIIKSITIVGYIVHRNAKSGYHKLTQSLCCRATDKAQAKHQAGVNNMSANGF